MAGLWDLAGSGFGGLLRRLRSDAGLTQEELAQAAGVSVRSVSDLERGVNRTARKDTARLLADALRLPGPARAAFEAAARGRPAGAAAADAGWLESAVRGGAGLAGAGDQVLVSIAPPARHRDGQLPLRGREDLLAELAAAGRGGRVVVAHGLGGCGKTSLAAEVAYRVLGRGAQAWWVTAADVGRLATGMRALGRRLGLAAGELGHGDAADLVWRSLSGLRQEWLLVIDNADDPLILAGPGGRVADGTGWLRPVSWAGGLVLVTSRDGRPGSWGPWCDLRPVGMLSGDEAVRVLADHAGAWHEMLGGDAAAWALAGRLGRLPLALRIAGSFLAESPAVPAAFAEDGQVRGYDQYRQILDHEPASTKVPEAELPALGSDGGHGVIGRTWELTLDLLQARQMPEARRLLRLLACFGDAPVPHELLLHPGVMAGSPLFAGLTGQRLWEVLQALAGFGLTEITNEDESGVAVLRVHALVRDASWQAHGSGAERGEYLALAAGLLGRAATGGQLSRLEEQAAQPLCEAIAPHALHVFQMLTVRPGGSGTAALAAAAAVSVAAQWQAAQGLAGPAAESHRAVLDVRQRMLGPDHPDTIDARYQIAKAAGYAGDNARAEAGYREVAGARSRVLGPDHPETLEARHNTAAAMSFQGHYAAAEARYREVLADELRVLGPDSRLTLATRHEIARMAGEQGRYGDAEAGFRAVLADWLRLYGPDHPGTLNARSRIALIMAARGQHRAAEAELRDILLAQRVVSGPDHPRTLLVRRNIAKIVASQSEHARAEAEYRDVIQAMRQVLAADHPDILAARYELGIVFAAQGDRRSAIAEFNSVLSTQERILGRAHPAAMMTARALDRAQRQTRKGPDPP